MNHDNLWRTAIDTELKQINEYQTFREVSANQLPVAGSLSSWVKQESSFFIQSKGNHPHQPSQGRN